MAKDKEAVDVVEAPPVADVQPLTLQEFCTRLSSKDKRVEMIGAFHYSETFAGIVKDTEAAFSSRFAAFVTKPV